MGFEMSNVEDIIYLIIRYDGNDRSQEIHNAFKRHFDEVGNASSIFSLHAPKDVQYVEDKFDGAVTHHIVTETHLGVIASDFYVADKIIRRTLHDILMGWDDDITRRSVKALIRYFGHDNFTVLQMARLRTAVYLGKYEYTKDQFQERQQWYWVHANGLNIDQIFSTDAV